MILLVLRGEYLSRQEGEKKERQRVHGRCVFLRVYELRGRKERKSASNIPDSGRGINKNERTMASVFCEAALDLLAGGCSESGGFIPHQASRMRHGAWR